MHYMRMEAVFGPSKVRVDAHILALYGLEWCLACVA
jgi:hypothetical protein